MNGLEMLIKTLLSSSGLDIDEVKKNFTDARDTLNNTLIHFDKRLTAIEMRLSNLEIILGCGKEIEEILKGYDYAGERRTDNGNERIEIQSETTSNRKIG